MSFDKNKRKFQDLEAECDALRHKLALPNVRQALLGERLMDVIGIVASGGGRHFGAPSGGRPSQGFAADVSHCLNLCKLTRNIVQRGDVADMLTQSLRLQCGARDAHLVKRENFPLIRMNDEGFFYFLKGTTQLIRATLLNNLPRVLQLIQLGAPLDLVDESHLGYSALHWACSEGHEHVAKALLAGKYAGKGATVDLRSGGPCGPCGRGGTPLMSACALYAAPVNEALVTLLIENGAKQELQDEDGKTPLHYAVEYDKLGVVALLLAAPCAEAALVLQDVDGKTPLHYALHEDNEDNVGIVALLLAAPGGKAALLLKMNGCTPLRLAIRNGHTACEALLRAAGAKDEEEEEEEDEDEDEEEEEDEDEDEDEEEDEDEDEEE